MSEVSQDRVAIVAGLRTPFLRIATGYSTVPTRVLGSHLVSELVQRSDLDA
ncbi:MAG: acetyl-CoA acyltransferase, partial [Arenicella sp.]